LASRLPTRRRFLGSAAAGAAALGLGASIGGRATAATGDIAAAPVADGLVLFTGAGGNVLVAEAPDSLLMIDSGVEEKAEALMRAIADRFGGRPVATLFNTHWHLDHTGGNALAAAQGAQILAQDNTRGWMGNAFYVAWQERHYPAREPAARPTASFDRTGEMDFGGRQILYGHLPRAHTDGDLYVRFPDADVVAVGDVVSPGAYPVLDYSTGGWSGEMIDSLAMLLETSGPDTVFVAGAGQPVGRAAVQAQHDMMVEVQARMVQLMRQGKGPADMMAEGMTADFDADWGDPSLYLYNAYQGIYGHFRDMRFA